MHRDKRLWQPALTLLTVLVALFLTFAYPQDNSLGVDIDGSPRAQAARSHDPYDLTQLQVLNRAILEVKDHYVEPNRVDPQRMLLSGLNAIQRAVPPVLVHYEEGQPELEVQVNDQRRSFRVDDVDAPWALASRFREIFTFLQQNLQEEQDLELRDVEYAAVNGMLRTLDPHTVLLTPDVFEEMQMSTRGEFGGLGIVISIRDGHLTVIRPMPNTPATRAGLRRGDRIVKINDESTLNMPLSEAVDRLRGPPGSQLEIWIRREGANGNWSAPRPVGLTRAVIHIESVEHRMLEDGIGYIKISSFQGNTHEDMERALAEMHRAGLRGLVLDLRDDPGGLLDQAVRIADTFLASGTIVTTSSQDPRQRDEKFARAAGTEPDYPMVVLINGASASASEIVAGALKNHDRALVIGQRSFGKGSVQVLYNFQDGSALKLTIAQYLTPGDVSIQGVGIVPDIRIDSMTVDREEMDLEADQEYLREADLRAHLTHATANETEGGELVLRYYLGSEERRRLREADPNDVENEREDEFLTRFSQSILARARRSGRREMLEDAAEAITQARQRELARAVSELRSLGVDWTEGEDRGPSQVDVELSTDRPNNVASAGEAFNLRVRVTNRGDRPLHQLRAITRSDNRLFEGRELVFGRLNPGETREWTTTLGVCSDEEERRVCRVPRDTPNRADGIRVEFSEAHGHAPSPAEIRTEVRALERPQFAYSVQVADDVNGNGDGLLQKGEQASMYLRVKNVGTGRSYETQANLRNASGRGVLLHDGRFRIDDMQPGEERVVRFTFGVLQDFERDEAKLEVAVVDMDLREAVTERVVVPVAPPGATPTARQGTIVLRSGALLHEGPRANGAVFAEVSGGALALPAQAELGDFVRVDVGGGQPGWVARADLVPQAPAAATRAAVRFHMDHMPPRLEIDYGEALVTRSPTLRLRGIATDDQRVRDLYVFVGARKVFYRSNVGGGDARRADFEAELPLSGGINYVTVFARESDDVVGRRMFVVRRDAPDGALMETPSFDEDILDGNVHEAP